MMKISGQSGIETNLRKLDLQPSMPVSCWNIALTTDQTAEIKYSHLAGSQPLV